ncbi:hypothetical protein KC19_1G011900 [Ceratodon purpureus]|uniref:ASCH domain-containing protein n=1 Tax=Ceratodon purpureus TaxID=3225 RepID=A0A8T0J357_CERPU|nr:hypothetical protein KC19_1G011900 [Ceratodon purpureus]
MDTAAALDSCSHDSADLQVAIPDSPPHSTPACDPLQCLTSLCHSLLRSGSLNLPPHFCQGLLQHQSPNLAEQGKEALGGGFAADGTEDTIVEGLPVHPLYVHLALALHRWICERRFPRNLAPIAGINEDEFWKSMLDAWTETVVTQGSALIELWQGIAIQLDVQEPYSSLLKDGFKTVEGRCATDSYRSLRGGDLILVNESFLLQIKEVHWYPTFRSMIEVEGLLKVLPGVDSISEGVKVYRKFYTEAKEQAHGVLGVHVVRPAQKDPVDLLAGILNALGMDGVRALLGLRTTIGTVKEALPPPKSLLVDSFSALQNPDVAGCRITVGARALAKHVPRSLDGWWGSITGTEAEKNKLAESTLHRLMMHTVWMNIHLAPIPLFEIRVADGYGARWLADGSQFRGFLEPPMEEGYMKKWRH